MKCLLVSLFALLAFIAYSCKEPSPTAPAPEPQRNLLLTVADSSLREIWLQLSLPDTFSGRTIRLFRNNQLVRTFSVAGLDTLVLDSLLTPNQQYSYRVERVLDTVRLAAAELICTTLSITTRNFVWEVDTLGATMTHLYDVAVIHDSLIYVAGEIYLRDSLGQTDPQPHGFAVWNGQRWTFQKVPMRDYGTTELFPGRLFTILSFGANNVYACSYANLLHWNGSVWQEKAFFMTEIPFNGQVNKMWGDNANNIYCVGRTGAIYHYNGSLWRKIEAGSTATLWDIWGIGSEIYVCGFRNSPLPAERLLLKLTGDRVQSLSLPPDFTPRAIWFSNRHRLFIHNSSVGRTAVKRADGSWIQMPPHATLGTIRSLRGTQANDMFGVNGSGRIEHFNGENWATLNVGTIPDVFWACDYRSRTMCAVGSVGSFNTRGIVVRVKRQ